MMGSQKLQLTLGFAAVVGVRVVAKAALASPTTGRALKNKYLSV